MPDDDLADLEAKILTAVETLDRIEAFTEPSPEPNNSGLHVNLYGAKLRSPASYRLCMYAC